MYTDLVIILHKIHNINTTNLVRNFAFFRCTGKYFLSFLAVPHPYKPTASRSHKRAFEVKKLSKKTWCHLYWKSEVSSFTTLLPRLCSVVLPFFPEYISIREKYPFVLSAKTHTLMPHLIGFIGMYCFMEDRP